MITNPDKIKSLVTIFTGYASSTEVSIPIEMMPKVCWAQQMRKRSRIDPHHSGYADTSATGGPAPALTGLLIHGRQAVGRATGPHVPHAARTNW